jgi:hypothetical protein
MTHRASFRQILGEIPTPAGLCEVVAPVEGADEDARGRMHPGLAAFLRPVDQAKPERHLSADWPPHAEAVDERVPEEPAVSSARELFQSWSRRVRQALEQQRGRWVPA